MNVFLSWMFKRIQLRLEGKSRLTRYAVRALTFSFSLFLIYVFYVWRK